MTRSLSISLPVVSLALIQSIFAGDIEKDLTPKPVTFSNRELEFKKVLNELQEQTGNVLADRRSNATNPKLALPAEPGRFWPMLDMLCERSGIGFSAYQPDGGVALVDTPYRKMQLHHSGLFRFALKRISVTRDDETGTRHADATIDTAWEPRLKPLYVNVEGATVTAGKDSQTLERQSIRGVAGTGAAEIELRMKAPERAVARIDSIKGSLRVIAIPKMLEFSFAKPAAKQSDTKDGVTVTIIGVEQRATRWTIDVQVEYPAGAIVPLESFQTWMDNNRVWLSWKNTGAKPIRTLEPIGESPLASAKGMRFRYDFTPRAGNPLPAAGADYELRLTTPNRVVAITVPFEFKDVPLP